MDSLHVTRTFNLLSNPRYSKELFYYSPNCKKLEVEKEKRYDYFGNQDIAFFVDMTPNYLDVKPLEDFLFKEFKTDYSKAVQLPKSLEKDNEVLIVKPLEEVPINNEGFSVKSGKISREMPEVLQALLKFHTKNVTNLNPVTLSNEGYTTYTQAGKRKKEEYRIFTVKSGNKTKRLFINYKYINLFREFRQYKHSMTTFTHKKQDYIIIFTKDILAVLKSVKPMKIT